LHGAGKHGHKEGVMVKLLHTTWDDIQRLCEVVADKVRNVAYSPEIIVAVSRGGFAPARILCDLLEVKHLTSVGITYYTSIGEREEKPTIVYPVNADVKGRTVLIVDDVADTGQSLVVARRHVQSKGADVVKIATLHYKPWSIVKPHFYGETTSSWVVYIWEMRETVKQLIFNLQNEGRNEKEVKTQLLTLGFQEETVNQLWDA
jgi:hypoxanthine phosphoribosyltransferase